MLINYLKANKLTVQRNELEDLSNECRRVDEEYDVDIKEMIEVCKENKRVCRLCTCVKIKHDKEKI